MVFYAPVATLYRQAAGFVLYNGFFRIIGGSYGK